MSVSRKTQVRIAAPMIVAQKGVRGFHLSNIIDANTTICDVRLARTDNLYELLMSLKGSKTSSPMPMVFETKGTIAKGRSIPAMCAVFKYAEYLHSTETIVGSEKVTTFEGVIVDNKNQRYEVRCDSLGISVELRLIRQRTSTPEVRVDNTPIVQMVPKTKPAEVHYEWVVAQAKKDVLFEIAV